MRPKLARVGYSHLFHQPLNKIFSILQVLKKVFRDSAKEPSFEVEVVVDGAHKLIRRRVIVILQKSLAMVHQKVSDANAIP